MNEPLPQSLDPDRDLTLSRVIKASRAAIWRAWADPASLEQWWLPAPALCQVVELDLSPGGAFITRMSEGGNDFEPHFNGCFLAVDENERLVFTNALTAGWRPAEEPFMTAIITLREHANGTEYLAQILHKNAEDRSGHEEMGFHDGWSAVIDQLAALVEKNE